MLRNACYGVCGNRSAYRGAGSPLTMLASMALAAAACAGDDFIRVQGMLARAMFPPVSQYCRTQQDEARLRAPPAEFSVLFDEEELDRDIPGRNWDSRVQNAGSEEEVFRARLQGNFSDGSAWRLGVSGSGAIHSFLGPFGEAMPPQVLPPDGAFMTTALGTQVGHDDAAINQAGGSAEEDGPAPGLNLGVSWAPEEGSLYVMSLGEARYERASHDGLQAIFYTRYTDCGDGAIEVTKVILNTGRVMLDEVAVTAGAFRTSTLGSAIVTGRPAHEAFAFGAYHKETASTLGYTMFAQGFPPVPHSDAPLRSYMVLEDTPCHPAGTDDLIYPFAVEPAFSSAVLCRVSPTGVESGAVGCVSGPACQFTMYINELEGFDVLGVERWVDPDGFLALYPVESWTAELLNDRLHVGDTLTFGSPRTVDRTLAHGIAMVHGTHPPPGVPGSIGVRFPHPRYNMMTFLDTARVSLAPGEAFTTRTFMLSGPLRSIDPMKWVPEAERFIGTRPPTDDSEAVGLIFHMWRARRRNGSPGKKWRFTVTDTVNWCVGTDFPPTYPLYKCQGSAVHRGAMQLLRAPAQVPIFAWTCGERTLLFAETLGLDGTLQRKKCDGGQGRVRLLGYYAPDCLDPMRDSGIWDLEATRVNAPCVEDEPPPSAVPATAQPPTPIPATPNTSSLGTSSSTATTTSVSTPSSTIVNATRHREGASIGKKDDGRSTEGRAFKEQQSDLGWIEIVILTLGVLTLAVIGAYAHARRKASKAFNDLGSDPAPFTHSCGIPLEMALSPLNAVVDSTESHTESPISDPSSRSTACGESTFGSTRPGLLVGTNLLDSRMKGSSMGRSSPMGISLISDL